jgi:hypothetical protein
MKSQAFAQYYPPEMIGLLDGPNATVKTVVREEAHSSEAKALLYG